MISNGTRSSQPKNHIPKWKTMTGSLNPKKEKNLTHTHSHRQTRNWIQRTSFQGFRNFSFNLSIIKDRSNYPPSHWTNKAWSGNQSAITAYHKISQVTTNINRHVGTAPPTPRCDHSSRLLIGLHTWPWRHLSWCQSAVITSYKINTRHTVQNKWYDGPG